MNPNDVQTGVLALAQCRAILGGHMDRFRIWWDNEATESARNVLLTVAGKSTLYAGRSWAEMPEQVRMAIKVRARDLRDWLNRIPLDVTQIEKVAA